MIYVPDGMTAGPYYLIINVDSDNQYEEIDETNNLMTYALAISNDKADLDHEGLILAKPEVAQGQSIDITHLIKNKGETPSGKFEISYALKANMKDPIATMLFSNLTYSKIIVEKSQIEIHSSIQIPDYIPTGSYFLVSCLDAKHEVDEMTYDNNCGQILIDVIRKTPLTTTMTSLPLFSTMKVYPNPASDAIHLEGKLIYPTDQVLLKISDYTGRLIYKEKFNSSASIHQDLNVAQLSQGIYILEMTSTHGTWKQSFVKH